MTTIIKDQTVIDSQGRKYSLEIRTAGLSYEVILSTEDAAPGLYRTLQSRKYTTLAAANNSFNKILKQF